MHYIRLLTSEELSETQMVSWFNTVMRFAPANTVLADESDELDDVLEVEETDIGDEAFPYVHLVELRRDLLAREAEWIVSAWEMRYDGDFEIETSNLYRADADPQHPFEIEMEDDVYDDIKETAAKFLHNRWVEAKNLEGWRYATRLNINEKTHPALRDWDSLSHQYRKFPTMTKTEALDFYTKYRNLFR